MLRLAPVRIQEGGAEDSPRSPVQVQLRVMGEGGGFKLVWEDLRDVCACVYVCVRECVCVCIHMHVCAHVCVAGLGMMMIMMMLMTKLVTRDARWHASICLGAHLCLCEVSASDTQQWHELP